MTTTTIPKAIILYVRQSDARDDWRRGNIDDHIRLLKEEAARRGWGVRKVVIENDVPDGSGGVKRKKSASASKRVQRVLPDGSISERVARKGFASVLEEMWAGTCDGLLAVELERAMRDPYDLEDLMVVVGHKKLNVDSLSGSLRFTDGGTDQEITNARYAVNRAADEALVKKRRALRCRERDLGKAKGNGGLRPYGWPDYKTADPVEKLVVGTAMRMFLHNVPLGSIAAQMREAEVPSVSGRPWTAEMLKSVLLRPRNAGLVIHRGEIVDGAVGEWEPLVSVDLYMAVRDKLTDESRSQNQSGPASKYQGSGIYECGVCCDGTTVKVTAGARNPRYVCKDSSHLARNRVQTDACVDAWMIARFSQPDAIGMFTTAAPEVDVPGLRAEREAIEQRLKTLAVDSVRYGRRGDYRKACEWAVPEIKRINNVLREAVAGDSLVTDLVTAKDVAATWASFPLATRREIIRTVCTVRIVPVGRNTNKFRPESIVITPKVWARTELVAA